VVLGAEARAAGDLLRGTVHGALEAGRCGDVFDGTALDADQVMVMTGQVLGQLVARELVVGDDPPHGAGLFEHDEVAVHGALRQLGLGVEDLVDRERPGRRLQGLDDREPVAGGPLTGPREPVTHLGHESVESAPGGRRVATGCHRPTVPVRP
jgi:hypothetical protein